MPQHSGLATPEGRAQSRETRRHSGLPTDGSEKYKHRQTERQSAGGQELAVAGYVMAHPGPDIGAHTDGAAPHGEEAAVAVDCAAAVPDKSRLEKIQRDRAPAESFALGLSVLQRVAMSSLL